ncbi:MAG TPA: RraA family protein [Casimicrobiaceae bacterium]|nr:RraA family protein [Casimicrobiaceae bacterium]
MASIPPTSAELSALAEFDTPTICNALELLIPESRARGYTTRPAVCGFPALKPVVGFARTARIRARNAPALGAAEVRELRHAYYRYIDAGPKPSVVLIQDLDGADAGYGAFWGEVQSAIHRGLGSLGVVTNGSVRDIDQWAAGFQLLAGAIGPSHAYANLVDFGSEVEVLGMPVRSGDIVHADRHGAVVVPVQAIRDLPEAAGRVARREAEILAVARAPDCTAEKLIAVFKAQDAIH